MFRPVRPPFPPLVDLLALTMDGRALPLATSLKDKPNMRFAKRHIDPAR
jgi:hypothetical protein